MATIEEARQQLQLRRQSIESAQKQVGEFQPQPEIPQSILRQPIKSLGRDSPQLRQARIKELVVQRGVAKQQAEREISQALQEQEEFESQLQTAQAAQDAALASRSRILNQINRWAEGKSTDVSGLSAEERNILNQAIEQADLSKGVQEQIAIQRLVEEGVELPVAETYIAGLPLAGPSEEYLKSSGFLPMDLLKAQAKIDSGKLDIKISDRTNEILLPDIKKSIVKKETFGRNIPEDIFSTSFVQDTSNLRSIVPTVPKSIQLPSFGERIRGEIRSKTGISIPGSKQIVTEFKENIAGIGGTIGWGGEQLLKEFGEAKEFVFTRVPEYTSIKVSNIVGSTTEKLQKAGLYPSTDKVLFTTTYPEFQIQTGIASRGTRTDIPTASDLIIPEKKTSYTFSTPAQARERSKQFTKGVTTLGTYGLYAVPYLGQAMLVSDVYSGIKSIGETQAQIKSVSSLTPIPKSEYSLYEKGAAEEYNKQLESIKSQAKVSRNLAIGGTALAGTFLLAKPLKQVTKAPFERVLVRYPTKPQAVSRYSFIGEVKDGKIEGIGGVLTKTPAELGVIVPKYKVWYGKTFSGKVKGKPLEISPASEEFLGFAGVSVDDVFKITSVSARGSRGASEKRFTPLKRFTTSIGKAEEVSLEDIYKVSPAKTYLAKGLMKDTSILEKVGPEGDSGVKYFFGESKSAKGLATTQEGLYVERVSKGQMQLFKGVPKISRDISAIRVISTGDKKLPTGTLYSYDVDAASKSLTSPFPKASGRINKLSGEVALFMKETPEVVDEAGDIFAISLRNMKAKTKPIVKPSEKQVADIQAAISKIVPKKPTSRTPKSQITPLESYKDYPTYVGGLSSTTSSEFKGFRGKEVEIENIGGALSISKDIGITKVPGIRKQVVDRDDLFTRDIIRTGIKADILTGIKSSERLAGDLIMDTRIREEGFVGFFPGLDTGTKGRFKLREGLKEDQGLKFKQVQRPEQRIKTPQPIIEPTKPRLPTRGPPTRIKVKLPKAKPEKETKREREPVYYTPFIRREGKYIRAGGKSLSLETARRRGIKAVRKSIAASLQVRETKTGRPVAFQKASDEFRFGASGRDPTTLVQKKRQRLKGRGEVLDIIQSRRAGGFKFFK